MLEERKLKNIKSGLTLYSTRGFKMIFSDEPGAEASESPRGTGGSCVSNYAASWLNSAFGKHSDTEFAAVALLSMRINGVIVRWR